MPKAGKTGGTSSKAKSTRTSSGKSTTTQTAQAAPKSAPSTSATSVAAEQASAETVKPQASQSAPSDAAQPSSSSASAKETLSDREWKGLAKLGEATHEIEGLLTLIKDVLKELPEAIDIDSLMTQYKPKYEALRESAQELLDLVEVDSIEALHAQVHKNIEAAKDAHIPEAIPEFLEIVKQLKETGTLDRIRALLPLLDDLPKGNDFETLVTQLRSVVGELDFWKSSAQSGMDTAADTIHELKLIERVDTFVEIAEQWLILVNRLRTAALGDAETTYKRAEAAVTAAEHWLVELEDAYKVLETETPELFTELQKKGVLSAAAKDFAPSVVRSVPTLLTILATAESTGMLDKAKVMMDAASVLPATETLEKLVKDLKEMSEGLQYWGAAAKDEMMTFIDGMPEAAAEMNLIEKVEVLQANAQRWLKVAEKMLAIAQGDSDTIIERVEALVEVKAHWVAEFEEAFKAVQESAPEALEALNQKGLLANTARDLAPSIQRMAPDLIAIIKSAEQSGMIERARIMVGVLEGLPRGKELEDIATSLRDLINDLPFWMQTVKQGLDVAGDMVHHFRVVERMDMLQEAAYGWIRLGQRVQPLIDDVDFLDKAHRVIDMTEYWGTQLSIGFGVVRDMLPEAVENIELNKVMEQVASASGEWLVFAGRLRDIAKGDSTSVQERLFTIVEQVEESRALDMLPEVLKLVGAVNRSGILTKAGVVMDTVQPYIPSDEEFKGYMDMGTGLINQYRPEAEVQAKIALRVFEQTQTEMKEIEQETKGGFGGMIKMISEVKTLVFSKEFQVLVRFGVRLVQNFIKAQKEKNV